MFAPGRKSAVQRNTPGLNCNGSCSSDVPLTSPVAITLIVYGGVP